MKRKFQVRFLEGCGAEMPSRLLGGYNAEGRLPCLECQRLSRISLAGRCVSIWAGQCPRFASRSSASI